MFRGFKIDNIDIRTSFNDDELEYYKAIGENIYQRTKRKFSITNFLDEDGILDGSKIQSNCFPTVEADIFISHSHEDLDLVKFLAGFLYKSKGLISFTDSCVWDFVDELLREIDEIYSSKNNGYYSYELRNHTTSHVHMMLITALMKMIDETECLFFLNTPSSISIEETMEKTYSPWIYAELAISKIIQCKLPKRFVQKSAELFENFSIKYDVDLSHLYELSLAEIQEAMEKKDKYAVLDDFYKKWNNYFHPKSIRG